MRRIKEIHFTQARQNFSDIVDQVEKSGKPVTILRHGKPAVVLVNHEEYQLRSGKKRKWKLAGSVKFRKDIDVDQVIEEGRKQFEDALGARQRRLLKETHES